LFSPNEITIIYFLLNVIFSLNLLAFLVELGNKKPQNSAKRYFEVHNTVPLKNLTHYCILTGATGAPFPARSFARGTFASLSQGTSSRGPSLCPKKYAKRVLH
jgi:hypothetical protein